MLHFVLKSERNESTVVYSIVLHLQKKPRKNLGLCGKKVKQIIPTERIHKVSVLARQQCRQ